MALPDLIEIVPLPGPVQAHVTVPGSKSITNRALILAALSKGETTLSGALWSEDTQIMVAALQSMAFGVTVVDDPAEPCNRTITVRGEGGRIPYSAWKTYRAKFASDENPHKKNSPSTTARRPPTKICKTRSRCR